VARDQARIEPAGLGHRVVELGAPNRLTIQGQPLGAQPSKRPGQPGPVRRCDLRARVDRAAHHAERLSLTWAARRQPPAAPLGPVDGIIRGDRLSASSHCPWIRACAAPAPGGFAGSQGSMRWRLPAPARGSPCGAMVHVAPARSDRMLLPCGAMVRPTFLFASRCGPGKRGFSYGGRRFAAAGDPKADRFGRGAARTYRPDSERAAVLCRCAAPRPPIHQKAHPAGEARVGSLHE
jgi:hypothetical protein